MDSLVPVSSSVSVAYLQGLLDYLARQGVDSAELQQIAARLTLSPRTLQRRLREAGLSFSRRWRKGASSWCCATWRWRKSPWFEKALITAVQDFCSR